MFEKIHKGQKATNAKDLERAAIKAWKGFLGSRGAGRQKAAGEFLLAFTRLAQGKGVHAEMSLQKAAKHFEMTFRKTENPK